MKIYELREKEPFLPVLLEVWEASVRATHRFLSEEEIMAIKKYVPQAIRSVEHLVAAEIDEKIIGFMGTQNRRLDFTGIWDLKHIKGRIVMRRENHTLFYI